MRRRVLLSLILAATTLALSPACNSRHVRTEVATTEPGAAGQLVDWRYLDTVSLPGHRLTQAHIYRFSYVTQSDRMQVATARIAIPTIGYANYDLVAHLHGTIGFADHCAPSVMPGFGFETPVNPLPADMVAAGHVVVMPDYPGLGAPGPHRYVERAATGRSVWDALVAAQRVVRVVQPTSTTSNRVLLMGHSQGGHALFSALSTQRESDDFDVVGAVAFAPPGDAQRHAELVAAGQARPAPFAWALSSYARAYPDVIDRDHWFAAGVAESLPAKLESQCAPRIKLWLGDDPAEIFSEHALQAFEQGELPAAVLEAERIDRFTTDVDIVVFHGTRDQLLPPELSEQLASTLAEHGTHVDWRPVRHAGHLTVPRFARRDALDWIDTRL